MNIYSLSAIWVVVLSSLMAILVFAKGYHKKQNTVWISFCLMAVIWGTSGYFISTTSSKTSAFKWWQFAHVCGILSPVLYSHFVFEFLNLKKRVFLMFSYSAAIGFLICNYFLPDYFLGDLRFVFDQFYWHDWYSNRSIIFLVYYISFYWVMLTYSFLMLILQYNKEVGVRRNQLKYFMLGSIVSWFGAECMFLLDFHIDVYPLANFLLGLYPVIMGYAIIRYRLMDISVVITRTGIFIAVYSLVLGIPYWLAFGFRQPLAQLFGDIWWIVPLMVLTVLATAGPFIYLYFQRRAENKLFQEQHRYQ